MPQHTLDREMVRYIMTTSSTLAWNTTFLSVRQRREQDRAAMMRMWESNATLVSRRSGVYELYCTDPFCYCYLVDDNYREGDIRLVGGTHNWEGRVEVFWSGIWVTISDTNWGITEAEVVCEQLGLPSRSE